MKRFALLLLVPLFLIFLTGCLPALTFLGFRIHERTVASYEGEIAPVLKEWKAVINDWENKANDPERSVFDRSLDAEDCHNRMQAIASTWDAISPSDEVMEYHSWMRQAMDYEREAFRVMREYYHLAQTFEPDEGELRQLRNLATELWVLKDKALHLAISRGCP